MPTSTGLDAFFSSLGEGEGGLSTAFSKQRLPLHCFRLCSIKIRMSPNGKFIWHWPQVRRSWSPSGAPNVPCSGSSSVRMASRGSAAVWETKGESLELLGKGIGHWGGGVRGGGERNVPSPVFMNITPCLHRPPAPPQLNPCNTAVSTAARRQIHQLQGKRFCRSSCSMQNSESEHCNCVPTWGQISDSIQWFGGKIKLIVWKNTLQNSVVLQREANMVFYCRMYYLCIWIQG